MLGETVIAMPYLGAGLDGLYRVAGWDIFGLAVIEKPEAIAEYLDALSDRTVKVVHLYAEHITARDCPVALGAYSDIASKNGLLLSPQFLRLALKPAVTKIVAAYHEHGIKVVYHSEGDIRGFVDDLVEAGVDGINPVDANEHMDAVEIRHKYPHLILWGGIENSDRLVFGTPEEVRREVERVVSRVGKGLIVGASGGIHPACRVENCIAMIEALHRLAD
jgi:uroporphyrinogen-III decarboxylase